MVINNKTIIEYYKKKSYYKSSPIKVIKFDKVELQIINTLVSPWVVEDEILNVSQILSYWELPEPPEYIRDSCFTEEDDYMINDYNKKNSKDYIIDRKTKFDFNFAWYEDEEYLTDADPNSLLCKYPSLGLSRIGFNKDKSKCLIFCGHMYMALGGSGDYFVLQKKPKDQKIYEWKIVNVIPKWIS